MNPPEPASIAEVLEWARWIMGRKPDFTIGDNYLRRWYVVPRNPWCNVYLHQFKRSDDDRALHDHPWANASLVLAGRYIEHTPEGQFLRVAGDFIERPAEALHRIEIVNDEPAITLFTTGPKLREWGFACPQGWVPWQLFADPGDASQTGRGCGES